MYRLFGLIALVLALIVFSAALVATLPLTLDPAQMDDGLPRAIIVLAFVAFGSILTFSLWRWLKRQLPSMPDLAIFIVVLVGGIYSVVALISLFGGLKAEEWTQYPNIMVPITVAAICFWILDTIRKWLDIKSETVAGETVAGIQRNNVFNRFEGPGAIWLPERMDKIVYTIETGRKELSVTTDVMEVVDLPFKYTILVQYRLDPYLLRRPDDDNLNRLTTQSSGHRRIVQSSVQGSMRRLTTEYDVKYARAKSKDWFSALLYIIPGLPKNQDLMAAIRKQAAAILKEDGIALDSATSLAIVGLYIPANIIRRLTGPEIARLLAEHGIKGDGSRARQINEWIRRADPLDADDAVNIGQAIRGRPAGDTPPVRPSPASSKAVTTGIPDPVPPEGPSHRLTADDLSIMKTIPMVSPSQGPAPEYNDVTDLPNAGTTRLSKDDLSIMQEYVDDRRLLP